MESDTALEIILQYIRCDSSKIGATNYEQITKDII